MFLFYSALLSTFLASFTTYLCNSFISLDLPFCKLKNSDKSFLFYVLFYCGPDIYLGSFWVCGITVKIAYYNEEKANYLVYKKYKLSLNIFGETTKY